MQTVLILIHSHFLSIWQYNLDSLFNIAGGIETSVVLRKAT